MDEYSSLQEAINYSQDGDIIYLWENIEENIYSSGKVYTLDLQEHTITRNSANSSDPVFYIYGGSVTLKNGTITGGYGSYGGLRIYNCDLFYGENLMIVKNTSTNGYGAIFFQSCGEVTLKDCTISDNLSGSYGSGIAVYGGTKLIGERITVLGNGFTTRYKESYRLGGGIYIDDTSSADLTDCTISGNEASYGAGIYAKGVLSVSDSEISDNIASTSGGGIYITGNYGTSDHTLVLENCTVSNNSAKNGGGIYADYLSSVTLDDSDIIQNSATIGSGAMYIDGESISITNTSINENSSPSGSAAIYISCEVVTGKEENLLIDNVTISKNESQNASIFMLMMQSSKNGYCAEIKNTTLSDNEAADILFVSGLGTCLFESCEIVDNNSSDSTVYLFGPGNAVFNSCTIARNTAVTAGGICVDNDGTCSLADTVIKNNTATSTSSAATGGVWVSSGQKLEMTGGAVYQNMTAGEKNARDWYIAANQNVSILRASDMHDPTDSLFSFAKYIWRDTESGAAYEDELSQNSAPRYLIAALDAERYVARIGSEQYTSLASAVENAEPNDTIVLIAGEDDEYGMGISSDPIVIDKSLTIDMNGRRLTTSGKELFTLTGDAVLTLVGTGSEDEAVLGNVTIQDNAGLRIEKALHVDTITHQGGSLEIDASIGKCQITLGEGKWIDIGGSFQCKALEIILSDDLLQRLNDDAAPVSDIIIAKPNLAGLSDRITIPDLTNQLVLLQETEEALVLRKMQLDGIYIDGVNGDDANDGTYASPVRSFERAKALLEANANLDTIYVMDQITISDQQTWELSGKTLARYPNYKGNLVSLSDSAVLTLKDIILDGASQYQVNDALSLINVGSNAELIIENGTILQNNDVSNHKALRECSGGAIYSAGTLTMNGGTIQNCSAINGGGIYCYLGTFTLKDGVIQNNHNDTALNASGGGVYIDYNAQMLMYGGLLRGNQASYGGAIALGGYSFIPRTSSAETLVMDGGEISDNISLINGGGIFIQCTFTATINAGSITGNSGGSGNFGGGGIYVNGGKSSYQNGRVQIYNVVIANNQITGLLSADVCRGAGIAGCYTSDTRLYIENGGVIYQNTNNGQKDDILISNSDGVTNFYPSDTKSYISEFMLGGGAYFWKWYGTDKDIGINSLHSDGVKGVYTDRTDADECVQYAKANAKVFITDNTAISRGGGIGSNGDVYIGGTLSETINISVTKRWDDENDAGETRPDRIAVWLLRNGERVSCLEFRINYYDASSGNTVTEWPETLVFSDQPARDENGVPYVYTIEEDTDGLDCYISVCEKISDTEWIVTNMLKDTVDISVTKRWEDENNAGLTRPASISIWLLRNGERASCLEFRINYYDADSGKIVTEWPETLVFSAQPASDENGVPYVYTVEEDMDGIDNYISACEKISDTEWIVTNTLKDTVDTSVTKDTVDISVTKRWEDENNAGLTRPAGISIWLLRNGERTDCLELQANQNNEWPETLVFSNQPAHDENGVAYIYTIEEDMSGLDGYTSVSEKIGDTEWIVTNTLLFTAPSAPPQTGDHTPLSLWLALTGSSLIGAALLIFSRKRF